MTTCWLCAILRQRIEKKAHVGLCTLIVEILIFYGLHLF